MHWKEGRLALSGNGLAIIKSALTEEEKGKLGILYDTASKVVHIPAANGFAFEDACRKHNVGTVWMGKPTEKVTLAAVLPPFRPVDNTDSARHTIQSCLMKSGTSPKKTKEGLPIQWELMNVVWGDQRYVVWDKKLWPLLEAGKGKLAALQTVPSFDKKKDPTIEGIDSIGDTLYECINEEWVPIPMHEDGEFDQADYR